VFLNFFNKNNSLEEFRGLYTLDLKNPNRKKSVIQTKNFSPHAVSRTNITRLRTRLVSPQIQNRSHHRRHSLNDDPTPASPTPLPSIHPWRLPLTAQLLLLLARSNTAVGTTTWSSPLLIRAAITT
jgi:hypothetical protein